MVGMMVPVFTEDPTILVVGIPVGWYPEAVAQEHVLSFVEETNFDLSS